MTQREVQHLYLRAGFGAKAETIQNAIGSSQAKAIDIILAESARLTMLEVVRVPTEDEMQMVLKKDHTAEEKKKIRQYKSQEEKKLNLAWLRKMMSGKEMLNEKMTFFWHDHFACKDGNPLNAQSLNNTIRKYALGDFRQLLGGVSKEIAMLRFLNNQQNRKNAPNENFAREVLELFTLGRGNYKEDDIKNAAKAFTGWGFDRVARSFEYKEKQHDFGEKTFLGTTGNLSGEDVLRIISENRQCAYYITDKIYRYFVNEKGNAQRSGELADSFYTSGYDIAGLMRSIFSSNWFYEEENIGNRIKSPVELVASLGCQFQPVFHNDDVLILVQRVLGQTLFDPPNVAGWPNGKEWIDSSSLIFRISLGKKMIESEVISTAPKPDEDKNPNEMVAKKPRFSELQAQMDWKKLREGFPSATDGELIDKVSSFLLQVKPKDLPQFDLNGMTEEQKLKKICTVITALPEYQLC